MYNTVKLHGLVFPIPTHRRILNVFRFISLITPSERVFHTFDTFLISSPLINSFAIPASVYMTRNNFISLF